MKRQRRARYFAAFMLLNILIETVSPTVSLALTNGPLQPELSGFTPSNSSEMVDLFTGDFKYNIPLLDVDGYPVNLSYKAGQGVDAEASWVGLGWSLNPGVMNRMVKGLPDDFKGDLTTTTTYMKPGVTMGIGSQWNLSVGVGISAGYSNGSVGFGQEISKATIYNIYSGYGMVKDHDSRLSLSVGYGPLSFNVSGGMGNSVSSADGETSRRNYSMGAGASAATDEIPIGSIGASFGGGRSINTRSGIVTKSYSSGVSLTPLSMIGIGGSNSSSLPSGPLSFYPRVPHAMSGAGWGSSRKYGFWAKVGFGIPIGNLSVQGGVLAGKKAFYNASFIETPQRITPSYGYLYLENADQWSLMDYNRFNDGTVMEETPVSSMSSSTYDLFFASAQGMATSFRAFRSDIGIFHDPRTLTTSYDFNKGYEVGGPLLLHLMYTNSHTDLNGVGSEWSTGMQNYLKFNQDPNSGLVKWNNSLALLGQTGPTAFIEKSYFKAFGELTLRDEVYEQSVNGEAAVSPELVPASDVYDAVSPIRGDGRQKRDIRSTYIGRLTGLQASQSGLEKTITLFAPNNFSLSSSTHFMSPASGTTGISRTVITSTSAPTSTYSIAHHLSELSVTNTDGDRYYYGIPVYNLKKKSVLFNASERKEAAYSTWSNSYEQTNLSAVRFPSTGYASSPLRSSTAYQMVQYDDDDVAEGPGDGNLRGLDNLVQKEEVPPYASSYLLTNITSPDYVDVTGDGPSYDDLGSFTKFNYSKATDYKWREPYCFDPAVSSYSGSIVTPSYQAAYNPGALWDELDDRGYYEYGVRQQYYLHSIETKNYVAVFKTSDKYDGTGVDDERGKMSTGTKTQKLDRIELYSKNEILRNGGLSGAIPIKTVHFEYKYTLCPNTFNSVYDLTNNASRGKLTLDKVYFTYGSSEMSALSPYVFKYADNNHDGTPDANYGYDPRASDRWGTYKPNAPVATGSLCAQLNNYEFPYAEQDKSLADAYAAAWNLTEIKTPSGATIQVTYEADDYGYVQNEQAGQMLQIYNCVNGSVSPGVSVPGTYSNSLDDILDAEYIIVDMSRFNIGIPTTLSQAEATEVLRSSVFKADKDLYFKTLMKLSGPEYGQGVTKDYYDYIPGYATTEEVGVFTHSLSGNSYTSSVISGTGAANYYKYAYVKLKKETAYKSTTINPFTRAGWDFMRNSAPRLAYPGSQPANMGDPGSSPGDQEASINQGLTVAKQDFKNAMKGEPNKRFLDKRFCNRIEYRKSFVRAYVPYKRKLGGGHRVKQISVNDGWQAMTSGINTSSYSENSTVYTQAFDYTMSDGINTISSGVAFYEPLQGNDEISLKQPLKFEIDKQYAPDDHFYKDLPLGEPFYPMGPVGYSKVTVNTIPDAAAGVTVAPNGNMVYEFYTAKDFPIYDEYPTFTKAVSDVQPSLDELLVTNFTRKFLYTAQGKLLKFNDMHGKAKSVSLYGPHEEQPATKIEYLYKTKNGLNGSRELVTTASCIDEHNVITNNRSIGRDIDVTADTRQNTMSTDSNDGELYLMELGLLVIPVPPYLMPGLPYIHREKFGNSSKYGVASAGLTKIVQQYGILEKVVVQNDKTITATENQLWDANTGTVVLTKTTSNFNSPDGDTYTFNTPAYWAYPQLSAEYKRDGISLNCPPATGPTSLQAAWNASSGILTASVVAGPPLIFELGDEVAVYNTTTNNQVGNRFWIVKSPSVTYPADYILVDQKGELLNSASPTYSASVNTSDTYKITVVRPFNKNKLNASMGQITSVRSLTYTSTGSVTVGNASVPAYSLDYSSGSNNAQNVVDANAISFTYGSSAYLDPGLSQQAGATISPGRADYINPVTCGYYTDYKPYRSYKYETERTYGTNPDARYDGRYSTFSPYWAYASGINRWDNCFALSPSASWKQISENTLYSPYGELLESKNAIGVQSAYRYGFNHSLPALYASNANAGQVGFDSFEEYGYVYPSLSAITSGTVKPNVINNDYLGFYKNSYPVFSSSVAPTFTNSAAHTGRYSLLFNNNQYVTLGHYFNAIDQVRQVVFEDQNPYTGCYGFDHTFNPAKLTFVPATYIASMWVKGVTTALDYSAIPGFSLLVASGSHVNATIVPTLVSKSGIINGWQKLDYEFTLSSTLSGDNVLLIIQSPSTGGGFYMDDFRIQPFNSTMVCNVYDPYSLRLCAQLDDRNFATIYEYDAEGKAVRTKKETEKAIYTLNETRSGNTKK